MGITLGDLFVRIRGDQSGLDGDLNQAEKKTQASAGRMGGFFTGALQHAVGGAILGGVQAIGGAITGAVSQAWDATKSYESMSAALNTLLTKEIQTQSVQVKRIAVGQKTIQVTEGGAAADLKKGESEADLAFKIQKTTNAIQVQNERLQEAIAKGKESAAEIEARRLRIQGMENQLAALNGRQGQAGTAVSKTITLYKEEKTAAIDIMTARKMAAEKTKELMEWSQKLAIQSPYSQDDVIKAMKMGIALGYNSDQAKRLTNANINFAAATGATGDAMSRITLALGQMQAKGKLAGGEMLQLTEAGVPMREILLESGKIAGLTTENFAKMQEKGLIPAKEAYEAYVEYMEKHFPTAAKDQANTLAGLQNSFEDLQKVVLRTAFEPMFRALQPYLVKFAEVLQNPALLATVQGIGAALGQGFGAALSTLMTFFSVIGNNIAAGRNPLDALRLALLNVVPPEFVPLVNTVINTIKTVIGTVTGLVAQFQTASAGGAGGIMDMLGLSPEVQATLTGIVASIQGILSQLVAYVQANLPAMKAVATDVFNGIGWLVQNVLGPWLQFLVTKVGEVIGWVNTNMPMMLQTFSTIVNAIMTLFSTAWPTIQRVALSALQSLQAGVTFVITLIQGIITFAMQAINGDWEAAWETLKTTADTLWQEILTFMQGFPKAMLDIGKKIIDGLIEGVKSKAVQFKEALLSILPPAIRAVLAQMGIASPSKVTMKIGNQLVDGLIVPFEKRMGDVREAMTGLIQPMAQAPAGVPALAGAVAAGASGAGNTSININMGGVQMANEMDAYSVAYRIAKRVKDGI
jgi:tape measure domain-containing protein